MQPTQELIDDIFRERVQRARRMTAEQKLAAGPQLLESACEIALAGIHSQFPSLSDADAWQMLRKRLEWRRRLDQAPQSQESIRAD